MVTNKFYRLSVTVLTILIGVALMLPHFFVTTAYAKGTKPRVTLSTRSSAITTACSDINSEGKSYNESLGKFISYNYPTLTLDMTGYEKLDSDEKQDFMTFVLDTISTSSIPRNDKIKMYNFVSEQDEAVASLVRQLSNDVNPDFAHAYSWFKPFSGGISTFLGFVCLALFTLLGIMMILDLSYLAIPIYRAWKDKTNGECPKRISREAFYAMRECEKDNREYKSAVGLYLKLKIKQIVLLGICLLYLVGGKLYVLVATIIDSLSGMIRD